MLDAASFERFGSNPKSFASGKEAGRGYYSSVEEATVPNTVMKSSSTLMDDGWVFWAIETMRARAFGQWMSYMPRIDALILNFKENSHFSLMEKLQPLCDKPIFTSEDCDNFERVDGHVSLYTNSYLVAQTSFLGHEAAVDFARRSFALNELLETFTRDANPSGPHCSLYFDLHARNAMEREHGGQRVVTDPFTTTERSWRWDITEKKRDEQRERLNKAIKNAMISHACNVPGIMIVE